MKNALRILFSVAEELAELARSSVPAIRKDEQVQREWLEDGIYYRETLFKGQTFLSQFDFKRRNLC